MKNVHAVLRPRLLALACFAAFPAARAAHVDPRLVAGNADADTLLVFDAAPPASAPLAPDADYKLRRRVLVDRLRAHADASQRGVRAWLDAHGVAYRSYWIANVIEARLPRAAIDALAARGDVARIEENVEIAMPLPRFDGNAHRPEAPESISWGVAKIGAPEVWALGDTGQGVVIAGEDTGYQWDHPALQPHYRGWDGAKAVHDYNWHDSIHDSSDNPCGNDALAPCDDYGHGTHTAGTFAGDDGAGHQIGVAPGATWIGCRNMDDGTGTPARYIECMQWLLAPTDLNDQNPNPDLAPDVVSNSWGCPTDPPPTGEGCTPSDILEDAVDNLVAGGIFFAAAAGNGSSGCGGILAPPALYDASFVVGATDSGDALAGFSLRGPVAGTNLVRPDLSAPGVNILSAWNNGGYLSIDGTSMATPHVAGAVALILSMNPALKGHPDEVANVLRATAVTDGVTDPVNQACGGTPRDQWPNNMIGYGRLDVNAAVIAADTLFADGFDSAP
jgi:subtilisin family serine protease